MEELVSPPRELEGFRLSPRQRRLWRLMQDDGAATYRTAAAVAVGTECDPAVLAAALRELVERHEVLRTAFPTPPGLKVPVQAIAEAPPAFELGEPPAPAAADELLSAFAVAEPESVPSLRAALAQSADHGPVLLLSLPALCADGASMGRLVGELAAAYAARTGGGAAGWDEEPVQVADIAEWQNGLLEEEETEGGRRSWRLDLAMPAPRLPFERDGGGGFAVQRSGVDLPAGVDEALASAAKGWGIDLEAVLLAAWRLLLERRAPGGVPALTCALEGRKFEELEEAVAPLATHVPVVLHCDLSAPFSELAKAAAEALETARRYQEFFSWEAVLGADAEPGGPAPWLPVAFEAGTTGGADSHGLPWSLLGVESVGDRFAVKLRVVESEGRPDLWIEHDAGRVPATAAATLAGSLATLLSDLAAGGERPCAELELLTRSEREVLQAVNATAATYPRRETLHGLIAERVASGGEGAAVVAADGTALSWKRLDERADGLARRLLAAGLEPGSPVGVGLHRSPELVVALLAVLRAGGAYLPLDPDYPGERLAYMLQDSGAALLVTDRELADAFGDSGARRVLVDGDDGAHSAAAPAATPPAVDPDGLAYVIYTSGSTGRPKGVAVSHRSAVNHMAWMSESFGIDADDRVMQRTPLSFDASVWELLVPLVCGATLVLDAPGNRFDGDLLLDRVRDEGVTVLQVVPSMLRLLVEAPGFGDLGSLRLLFSGGEALPRDLAERAAELTGAPVVNLYGPTEATIDSTYHPVRRGEEGAVPIGRPVANVRVHVLDHRQRAVPPGVTGELCLAGVALARGYLGRPRETAERFVPNPDPAEPGERLYRTGDLVRLREDVELEFVGRADHQVKLRGFRIELGEVEQVMAGLAGVAEAVAAVRGEAGDQRLIAYWTAEAEGAPGVDDLRSHLESRLPEHMVPALFVRLDELPLTPSGKVDRAALPEPDADRPDLDQAYVGPRNFEEELLCSIWAEVLGVDRVGIRDNFFALGADSIRSVRVVALARRRGLDLSLQMFFEHQTIEELVEAMKAETADAAYIRTEPFGLVPEEDRDRLPAGIEDAYPLTGLQQGMLFHMEVDPSAPAYHNVTGFHIRGPFHAEAFQRAVDRAVERYEVLRTGFDLRSYSEPLQFVHPEARLEVRVRDLRDRSEAERESLTDAMVEREKNTPFDLGRPPLLRFNVDRHEDDRYWFVLTECHSILDGWSLTSILREIFTDHLRIADGRGPVEREPLGIGFRDYVALERRARESEESRTFWQQQLRGAELLRVPRRRSAFRAEGEDIGVANLAVPLGDLADAVPALAHRLAVPVKSLCLAAHLKLLEIVSGEGDVLTGLPTNGRPDHPDGERIRGLFINTVPFRLRLDEVETWSDLVRAVFEGERKLLPHRRYPLDAMRRNWKDDALFEVLFSFVHFHHLERLIGDEEMSFLDDFKGWEATNFTLMVGFNRHPPDLDLKTRLYYNPHELSRGQVASYGDCLLEVLRAMTETPEGSHRELDSRALASTDEAALLDAPTRVDDLGEDFAF